MSMMDYIKNLIEENSSEEEDNSVEEDTAVPIPEDVEKTASFLEKLAEELTLKDLSFKQNESSEEEEAKEDENERSEDTEKVAQSQEDIKAAIIEKILEQHGKDEKLDKLLEKEEGSE